MKQVIFSLNNFSGRTIRCITAALLLLFTVSALVYADTAASADSHISGIMQNGGDRAAGSAPHAADAEAVLSQEACEILYEAFYRTATMPVQQVKQSCRSLQQQLKAAVRKNRRERDTAAEQHLLVSYLVHAKLLSDAYNYGVLPDSRFISGLDREVRYLLKKIPASSDIYLKYADYRYTKLVLPNEVFRTASSLPVLYRKALLFNPANREALVKLACWHIFAANEETANYNSFIEEQEAYLDCLAPVSRFNAAVLYSTYYMNTYNTEKGYAYFREAERLFPGHVLLSHLYENYQKGQFAL